MSMLFIIGDEIGGFTKYMISESIVPKTTDNYGTNEKFDNCQWFTTHGGGKMTFMVRNNTYYCIGISGDGEVMFLSSKDDINSDRLNDIQYVMMMFDSGRTQTKRILNLFGEIIYILIQGTLKFNHKKIYFDGADEGLDKTYSHMVKNKYLLKGVEELGYRYDTFEDGYHVFTKI